MAFTDTWDVTYPPDTQTANLLGQDLRNLRLDIQQRMGAISGLSTAMPTFGADAQPANWTGLLFFATDTGQVFQWSGTAWVDVTSSLIPISKLFSDLTTASIVAPGTVNTVTIPSTSLLSGNMLDIREACTGTGSNLVFRINGNTLTPPLVAPALGSNIAFVAQLFIIAIAGVNYINGQIMATWAGNNLIVNQLANSLVPVLAGANTFDVFQSNGGGASTLAGGMIARVTS